MPQPRRSWITQAFQDPDVERRYQAYRRERHKTLVRLSLMLGIFLFAIYVYLDCAILAGTWVSPIGCVGSGDTTPRWTAMRDIRLAMVGLLTLILASTISQVVWRRDLLLLFLGLASSGVAIITVSVLAHESGLTHYYVGLVLVILFAAFLFRIPPFATALLALVLILIYDVVAMRFIETHVLLNNNFFLGSVLLAALVGSRASETSERRVFWETSPIAREPRVFVSYSHRDRAWLDRLMVHLRPNLWGGRDGSVWADDRLQSGARWREEIREALGSASSAVLLVSKAYLASEFIHDNELVPLLEAESVRIHWICIDRCRWEESGLRDIQAVRNPEVPLVKLEEDDQEQTLIELAKRIADDLSSNGARSS